LRSGFRQISRERRDHARPVGPSTCSPTTFKKEGRRQGQRGGARHVYRRKREAAHHAGQGIAQTAGQAFATRLAARTEDREPVSSPKVGQAQIAAFRAWERVDGERFEKLRRITQPCLVVNGVFDQMIPVRNSYLLAEHLPNATLLTYPDAGHGSLFQFHDSFVQQAVLFLDS
jgi:pimeloyl-ACP methyl ester carboxylesterase